MFNSATEPQAMHRPRAGVIISQLRQRLANWRGIRLGFGEFASVPLRFRCEPHRDERADSSPAKLPRACGLRSPANLELNRLKKASAIGISSMSSLCSRYPVFNMPAYKAIPVPGSDSFLMAHLQRLMGYTIAPGLNRII